MEPLRRTATLTFAFIAVIVAATVLPQAALAASERGSKPEVVARRNEGGLAEALGLVRKVTVAGDRSVITYRAAGDKRPRDLVVDYGDVGDALLYSNAGSPLYWMMVVLVGIGLTARLARLTRAKEMRVPELARRHVPPADR